MRELEDGTENISIHVKDSDWYEEDDVEDKIEILTHKKLLLNVLL